MGMRFGYTEKEIARMYLGKWSDLFEKHKHYHNFVTQKGIYKEPPKIVSILDL